MPHCTFSAILVLFSFLPPVMIKHSLVISTLVCNLYLQCIHFSVWCHLVLLSLIVILSLQSTGQGTLKICQGSSKDGSQVCIFPPCSYLCCWLYPLWLWWMDILIRNMQRNFCFAGQSCAVSVVPRSTLGRVSDLSVQIHRWFLYIVNSRIDDGN